jgi:hypothetical protein
MITATTIDGFNGIGDCPELQLRSLRQSASASRSGRSRWVISGCTTHRAQLVRSSRSMMTAAMGRQSACRLAPEARDSSSRQRSDCPCRSQPLFVDVKRCQGNVIVALKLGGSQRPFPQLHRPLITLGPRLRPESLQRACFHFTVVLDASRRHLKSSSDGDQCDRINLTMKLQQSKKYCCTRNG